MRVNQMMKKLIITAICMSFSLSMYAQKVNPAKDISVAKLERKMSKDIQLVDRYPNKYYYAWGFNCFLNLGYKF